jgi:type IV pilus assembly protein PilE
MQKRHSRGITLIELMVVVIIIAILASIAYPSYRRYAVRTTRNEGKVALLQTTQRLERCFTVTHSYFDCIDEGTVALINTDHYAISSAVAATDTTYQLQAVAQGAQAEDDARCATLLVDQAGRRTVEGGGDEGECW